MVHRVFALLWIARTKKNKPISSITLPQQKTKRKHNGKMNTKYTTEPQSK